MTLAGTPPGNFLVLNQLKPACPLRLLRAEVSRMTSLTRTLQVAALSAALLLPAGTSMANDWSKPDSRTKGTIVGAVAGGLIGGKKGAVIGAVAGNGVQYARHSHDRNRVRQAHRRHHRHHRRT
jgi:hypothetical protein